jgi:hypothetical protein
LYDKDTLFTKRIHVTYKRTERRNHSTSVHFIVS